VGSSGVTDSDRVASEDACAEVAGGSMYGEWPAAADGSSTTVVVRVGARESGSGIDGRVVGGGVARWIG